LFQHILGGTAGGTPGSTGTFNSEDAAGLVSQGYPAFGTPYIDADHTHLQNLSTVLKELLKIPVGFPEIPEPVPKLIDCALMGKPPP
jgi:hypothetical protein